MDGSCREKALQRRYNGTVGSREHDRRQQKRRQSGPAVVSELLSWRRWLFFIFHYVSPMVYSHFDFAMFAKKIVAKRQNFPQRRVFAKQKSFYLKEFEFTEAPFLGGKFVFSTQIAKFRSVWFELLNLTRNLEVWFKFLDVFKKAFLPSSPFVNL